MIENITQTPQGYRATIGGVEMTIPAVSGNRHYQMVLAAIAAGAPVAQEPVPNPIPQEVSRFQAKAALALAGKLAEAEAAVQASGDVILQLAWAEATTFKRNSPGIAALAGGIGLDDAALDALFTTAAGIIA